MNSTFTRILTASLFVLQLSCEEPPLRSVEGNVLVSGKQPTMTIEFDKGLTFAGSQEFVLHGRAKAEQFFFVEDAGGAVRRMYLVQFDGYLDDNTYVYNYAKIPTIRIAGRDFHNDAGFVQTPEAMPEDGSDQAYADTFLSGRGYHYPREGMFQRMTWLWDEAARNKLMILYVEDLGEYGFTAADFDEGGKAADRGEAMKKALLDRALGGMSISEQR